MPKSRTYTLTAIVFAIAFVICWIAWMRFFYQAVTNPSPVRYVDFVTITGPRDPFRQVCAGPVFVDGDTVWRTCAYDSVPVSPSAPDPAWGLVRYDLAKGEAALLWPLPDGPAGQVIALAKSPADDLALAMGAPALSGVYRVWPAGGIESLGLPPDLPGRIVGLAWMGESLELVSGDTGPAAITSYRDGAWSPARTVPRPDACAEAPLCALQVARHDADGWTFLYAHAPDRGTDPANAEIALLLADESGVLAARGAIPVTDLMPGPVALDEFGQVARLDRLFDQSPGGVVNWTVDAAPYLLVETAWTRISPPDDAADWRFYFSNYRLEATGLRWIPGVRSPERGWYVGGWLELDAADSGTALAWMGGDSGLALTTNTTFLEQNAAHVAILPASGGGYWVLGPHGAYLKAGDSLKRADGLNIAERIVRAFENFGRLKVYNDTFYREQARLKMLALPMVLLSLPFGYLLVFFMRQARRNTRAWITLLLEVSAVYLVLTSVFMWWFWELMDSF